MAKASPCCALARNLRCTLGSDRQRQDVPAERWGPWRGLWACWRARQAEPPARSVAAPSGERVHGFSVFVDVERWPPDTIAAAAAAMVQRAARAAASCADARTAEASGWRRGAPSDGPRCAAKVSGPPIVVPCLSPALPSLAGGSRRKVHPARSALACCLQAQQNGVPREQQRGAEGASQPCAAGQRQRRLAVGERECASARKCEPPQGALPSIGQRQRGR